jgi:flavin reductase (DIM6/NTAB) family NADH-FMN oxidoreductase RutF/rubredoxin
MDMTTMHKLSYGLFVLTAREGDKDNGCIINTTTQVASEPNRIAIAVNKGNYTHDMILRTGAFTVSILSEEASFDLFKHFGFQSGRDVNKFADFTDCKRGANGILYVTAGTNGYLSGKVISTSDLGSHTLFIADVTDGEVLSKAPSATYAYYHAHIKPQPVGTAPSGKTIWRCVICGYEYEGDELPADFVCPLCKHGPEDFEKIVAQAAQAAPKTKTVWRCTTCGYEYEGEELPKDYVCPVCKHGPDDFEKVLVPVK